MFVEDALEGALATAKLSRVDHHLCQELVYGVSRWQGTLDWLIAKKTDGRAQKDYLRNLLRLGLYQIFWLDRVPHHAAVNETVELARRKGFAPQSGFINALLRNYVRDFESTKQLLRELKTTSLGIGFSHPEWLVSRWVARWGSETAATLLEWNNRPPPTYARVNGLKTTAEKLLPRWREEGVEYDFVRRDWLEENLVFQLRSHPPLGELDSFLAGEFYIQDPSTLLPVVLLEPRPDHDVVDLCAAPGGKLGYIAQLMQDRGRIVAHDLSPDRLRLVEQNCRRLGISSAQLVTPELLESQRRLGFDRVLVDAPCSNTGVMRRRIDLRWRLRPEEPQRLTHVQSELLECALRLVKPGGRIVYSTCSIEPEENRQLLEEFIRRNPRVRLERDRELLPFNDGVDGGYAAVLNLAG
jgi:16S rRNA (cytosine967-C5)-methyltransferase